MSTISVLIPLPSYGFDPTESAVPWKELKNAGYKTVFATPDGQKAAADARMLSGEDLPNWLKKALMAQPEAVQLYQEMMDSTEFQVPLRYDDLRAENFQALLLVGGHDKGMRPYLESPHLQKVVAAFFDLGKPVGAICHGTLLAARSTSQRAGHGTLGRSVLWGRKTTGLTRRQEMIAYYLTRSKLGDYYRTYDIPMADEVKAALKSPRDYDPGPGFPIPLFRDSPDNLKPAFVLRDRNYVSARWPGDAHKFGLALVNLIKETENPSD